MPTSGVDRLMNIGIDLRCLPCDGSPGAGIAHAATELVRQLITRDSRDITWILFIPEGAWNQTWEMMLRERRSSIRAINLKSATGASLRQALSKERCDRIFVPSGAVAPGLTCPVYPWVHDIAIFDHPEWFAESLIQRKVTTELFRRGLNNAAKIFAVSEFTKKELIIRFNLNPSDIVVTSEGGDSVLSSLNGEALEQARKKAKAKIASRGIKNLYILCLGTIEPRKNIPMLISAWSLSCKAFRRPFDLVIAGRDGWKLGATIKAMKEIDYKITNSSKLHRIEAPSDEYRRDLFLASEIVAVPSLYEGFSLPSLEGMQAGSVVIASNAAALPEVLGEAGIKIPPSDTAIWVNEIIALVNNDELRKSMAIKCKERSQEMTWKNAAKVVFNILTKKER